MDIEQLSLITALNFSVAIVVIWGSVLIAYTALADQGCKYMKGSSAHKWLNRCAAGAMVGAASSIALRN